MGESNAKSVLDDTEPTQINLSVGKGVLFSWGFLNIDFSLNRSGEIRIPRYKFWLIYKDFGKDPDKALIYKSFHDKSSEKNRITLKLKRCVSFIWNQVPRIKTKIDYLDPGIKIKK